ncbi:hypothetical protein BD769DRAFT_989528 [Suillus cothurnatus]|nr:hypothetical protein BD769DRAFT_989528 [Suillus cothurnatus]
MQTCNSNVDSLLVSATTGEPQKPHDIIAEDSGIETVTPHVDSPLVSCTIDELQTSADAVRGETSGLKTVRNSASYRQRQLVEEKATIVQSNTSRSTFSSVIWRLRTEFLLRIFLYCLPEDWYLSSHTSTEAPILLTQICHRWRELAVSSPRLWCKLRLEIGPRDWQKRAFQYESWLKRISALAETPVSCH